MIQTEEIEMQDYMHQVEKKIEFHKDEPGFPQMEAFGVDETMLLDYLLDKQAIMDSEGNKKSQYTVAGIIILIPIFVLAFLPEKDLPWGQYAILAGILFGIVLYLVYKGIRILMRNVQLKKINDPSIEKYISAVLNYKK